jgi:hypothetical protein
MRVSGCHPTVVSGSEKNCRKLFRRRGENRRNQSSFPESEAASFFEEPDLDCAAADHRAIDTAKMKAASWWLFLLTLAGARRGGPLIPASAIYPGDHWTYSTEITSPEQFADLVDVASREASDHTLMVRWIASEG